jgi:hypothetical protein
MKQINPTNKELNQLIEDHNLQLITNSTPSSNEFFKNGDKLLQVIFAPCGSYRKVFINFEIKACNQ